MSRAIADGSLFHGGPLFETPGARGPDGRDDHQSDAPGDGLLPDDGPLV